MVSAFSLYLEVLLIRWISTEIRVFAYFKNLTLIGCFFGLGLGCLLSHRAVRFIWTFPGLAGFCATIALPKAFGHDPYASITRLLGGFNEMPLWTWSADGGTAWGSAGALVLLVLLFLSVTLLFVPSGQLLGRWMEEAPDKIGAYSVNILGSLAGIGLFSLMSSLSSPPAAWFTTALLLGSLLLTRRNDLVVAVACAAIIGAVFSVTGPDGSTVLWSPYQKLEFQNLQVKAPNGRTVPVGTLVRVNETFYQRVVNLSRAYLEANRDLFPDGADHDFIGYNLPYRLRRRPGNVLVVGAGTGNDVAAALRNGAEHVDAVEIDPLIVQIGREVHPEKPYDDQRVSVHIDDARSYFKKTSRKYDYIVFGALDSHTLSSTLSNIRLDNYVYTVQSFSEARNLLSPDGIMVVVFSAERPFIVERLNAMLTEAFGHPPIAFDNLEIANLGPAGGGPTLLIDRAGALEQRVRASDQAAQAVIARGRFTLGHSALVSTDDWPYLYLERHAVPKLYLIVMGALAVVALLLVRPFLGELKRLDAHFALLGSAFVLVEVQAMSKMALLFGTTWTVNAIVLASIMVMILLSNLVAARFRRLRLGPAYAGLLASLALNYAFPFGVLLGLAPSLRGLIAGGVMALPVFFAGLVFIRTFADSSSPGVALGSNLLGAVVGDALESSSFVYGINGDWA